MLDPTSEEFKQIKKEALLGTVPDGPKFDDKTNMYHLDLQYDFKNVIEFVDLQAGGSYRLYDLNSNGTIFDDVTKNITINEVGAYVQAGKWLLGRRLKFAGSIRYDKNENFEGQLTPRISAVIKPGELHSVRFSFQTGFRNPPTQGQHIDLNILSARLIGGLPRYADKYQIIRQSTAGMPLSFDGYSVEKFRNYFFGTFDIPGAINLLESVTSFNKVKPENISTFEMGYKGVFGNNFWIDISGYYNLYNNFIGETRINTASEFTTNQALAETDPGKYSYNPDPAMEGIPNYLSMLNSTAMTAKSNGVISGNTIQVYSNSDQQVESYGAVMGMEYKLSKGYYVGGNYKWNTLRNVPEGFVSLYNTPEHKLNLMAGNRSFTDKIGFNLTWRWQDEFRWESGFTLPANGMVPAYSTLDAQISYKLKSLKSIFKIGGSNMLNKKYIQSLGGPNIGALYYLSVTFDEFMK
ncbi:MAG TPA: TonB-dependent receptor, partial [Cyclobacteriaceae bacterium]|nr:TonB-dependent receptor [Cyclobacteriaceae bacterium]